MAKEIVEVNSQENAVEVVASPKVVETPSVLVVEPMTHKVTALVTDDFSIGGIEYHIFKGKTYNLPDHVSVPLQNLGFVIRN